MRSAMAPGSPLERLVRMITVKCCSGKRWIAFRNPLVSPVWRQRRKLEHDPAHPRHIVTVRTFGYRIER